MQEHCVLKNQGFLRGEVHYSSTAIVTMFMFLVVDLKIFSLYNFALTAPNTIFLRSLGNL
jgi:hypothetical protein